MGLKGLQSAKAYKYFWKKNRLRKSHKGKKSKNAEHYYPKLKNARVWNQVRIQKQRGIYIYF